MHNGKQKKKTASLMRANKIKATLRGVKMQASKQTD